MVFNSSTRVIAVVDKTVKTKGKVDVQALIAASQIYVDQYFCPAWGPFASCVLMEQPNVPNNAWSIVLQDNADQEGVLGYHDETPNGLPYGRIFVETTLNDGEDPNVTFTHELAEILVDPFVAKLTQNLATGDMYPLETADAVEEQSFKIGGIAMSNFVLPTWFDSYRKPGSTKFDFLGQLTQPFELAPGGYAAIVRGGNIQMIFGSEAKAQKFAKEDRRGHRIEFWKQHFVDKFKVMAA